MAKAKQKKTKCRPRKGGIAGNVAMGKQTQSKLSEVIYDVHLQPGEVFGLPTDVADILGPGHWRVSITAADDSRTGMRAHTAFLNSYAPEDEGLYDDYSAG